MRIWQPFLKGIVLVIMIVAVTVVGPISDASAAYRDGRPIGGCSSVLSRTYFANDCRSAQIDPNGDRGYVLPRVNVGGTWEEAMYGVNSVDSLLNYLKTNHASPNERLYGPAAYIVHSMLGRSGDQANASGGKSISAADWLELETRLRGPGITIEWNALVDRRFNTSGRTGGDVAFVDRGSISPGAGIQIRYNGTIVYIIQRECANPIGDLPGLPIIPVTDPAEFSPMVTGGPSVVPVGESFTFSFRITNNSSNPGSAEYLAEIRDGNGNILPNPNAAGTTAEIAPGATAFEPPSFTATATDTMGDQVCATLSIVGGSTSVPLCVAIGKKPLFQAWNGDVWAGGSFGSGTCTVDSASPGNITGAPASSAGGSWGEYGVFALGRIESFGSAAQPHFGSQGTKLSFSNTTPSSPGYYHGNPSTHGRCLTDIFNEFGTGLVPFNGNNINVSGSPPAEGHRLAAGDVEVKMGAGAGAKVPAGRQIVVRSTGNITISRDIRYQMDGITDPSELPRVILLADGDIIINSDVTRVDAWLAAKGTIYTCNNMSGALTKNDCNQQLTINGPVIANEISLRRTFGAEQGSRNEPAEKFNLRPDAFLGAYANKSAPTQVRTIRQIELPARY